MFGIGSHELILILIVIVIIFGASKIPQLGSSIGQGIRNYKRSMREVREEERAALANKAEKDASAKDESEKDDSKV